MNTAGPRFASLSPRWRALLALSRLSALPTVWSNCLAGWWLGGAEHIRPLPLLFIGVTLIYLGSVFLKDAFDADYDRQHRPARPIPSGALPQPTVWRCGLGLLVLGAVCLMGLGTLAGSLSLGLVCVIILHHATYRQLPFSPVLLGICRFFLYLLGAAVAQQGITGWALWCALALGIYVTGLTYFRRWETAPALARYWPVILLMMPVLLALLMDVGRYREPGVLLSFILVLWILRCLRQTFWTPERHVKRTTAGLVAGIVFVDWLAACPVSDFAPGPHPLSYVFLGLFFLTLLLQKVLPEPGES